MCRGRDDHEWIFHEGLRDEIKPLRRPPHDYEVVVVVVEVPQQPFAIGDVEADGDVRIALAERRQQPRREVIRRARRRGGRRGGRAAGGGRRAAGRGGGGGRAGRRGRRRARRGGGRREGRRDGG